jgi:hypothetical protein
MYFKAIGALSISIELTLTGKILKALTDEIKKTFQTTKNQARLP